MPTWIFFLLCLSVPCPFPPKFPGFSGVLGFLVFCSSELFLLCVPVHSSCLFLFLVSFRACSWFSWGFWVFPRVFPSAASCHKLPPERLSFAEFCVTQLQPCYRNQNLKICRGLHPIACLTFRKQWRRSDSRPSWIALQKRLHRTAQLAKFLYHETNQPGVIVSLAE
jgi:hypothetical protein